MWFGCAGVCEGIQTAAYNRAGLTAVTLLFEIRLCQSLSDAWACMAKSFDISEFMFLKARGKPSFSSLCIDSACCCQLRHCDTLTAALSKSSTSVCELITYLTSEPLASNKTAKACTSAMFISCISHLLTLSLQQFATVSVFANPGLSRHRFVPCCTVLHVANLLLNSNVKQNLAHVALHHPAAGIHFIHIHKPLASASFYPMILR